MGVADNDSIRRALLHGRLFEFVAVSKALPTFVVEAMVRGYHVYQDVWDASIHEELSCVREPDNLRDPFAVAVIKSHHTVGHIPLKISSVCSLFLQRGGVA